MLLRWCADDWDSTFPGCSFASALVDAWQAADSPEDALGRRFWVKQLRSVGYLLNGDEGAARPAEPITVYRGGADPQRMAWTSDRQAAAEFAAGLGGRFPTGRLWRASAPVEAQLMSFDGTWGRIGEIETVVDPELLVDVQPLDQPIGKR